MSFFDPDCVGLLREIESKGGPFIRYAVNGNIASVPEHNPFYDGKADSGSFKFGGRMKSFKDGKKSVRIGHVEALSLIHI